MNTLLSTTSLRWSPLLVVGSLLVACTGGDAPTICGDPIEDQVLHYGEEHLEDFCFSDPEGAKLVFTASSSDTEVGTIVVVGEAVYIMARGVGNATMTVQAEDPGGNTASMDFNLEVPNRPPFGTLGELPRTRILTEQVREYYVDDFFRDPDKDPLFYTASIENTAVASGGMEDSLRLVITGLTVGETTVTLTATDPHGGVAEVTGEILVVEPVLIWRDDFDTNNFDWFFNFASYYSYYYRPGYLSGYNRYSYWFFSGERNTDDNVEEWMVKMMVGADEGSTNQLVGFWSYPPATSYACNTINFIAGTVGYTDEIHYLGATPNSNWQIWYYNCYPYKVSTHGESDAVAPVGEFTEMHWGVQRGQMQFWTGGTQVYSQDASEGPVGNDDVGEWPVVHSTSRLIGLGAQGETYQYLYYDWAELWGIDAYDDAADLSGGRQLRDGPASLSPMPPTAVMSQQMIIRK